MRLIIFIIGMVILVTAVLRYSNASKQSLTKEDVKKQVLVTEATLSEASFLIEQANNGKLTTQFTKVHADGLSQQLEQTKQSFTSSNLSLSAKKSGEEELTIINQATNILEKIKNRPNDQNTITQSQIVFKTLLKKESALEKTL